MTTTQKTAYFDVSYGVAGDMILGALVDAGLSFDALKRAIEQGLGVEGLRVEEQKVTRAGVTATRILIEIDAAHDKHRHLHHIVEIIEATDFPESVKTRAKEAYRRLAVAEAKVHNSTPERIHFHEVGCLDAIADVAGAMLGFELLGIERVTASVLTVGSGTARCAHGVIPVPAPATVELLRGIPTQSGPHQYEMTTPTGAAILATVSDSFGPQPTLAVEAVGYGAGKREVEGEANFLRVLIGAEPVGGAARENDATLAGIEVGRLIMLSTEIDDSSPELLGAVLEELFEAGCLDAHFTALQMKKSRPGVQLQVLTTPERKADMVRLILRRTTTFGVKATEVERYCLRRRREEIATEAGPLVVKVGLWGDEILRVTPEYESCRNMARAREISIVDAFSSAQALIQQHYFGAGARRSGQTDGKAPRE